MLKLFPAFIELIITPFRLFDNFFRGIQAAYVDLHANSQGSVQKSIPNFRRAIKIEPARFGGDRFDHEIGRRQFRY